MLETGRERMFFKDDPKTVAQWLEEFSTGNGGKKQPGAPGLVVIHFTPGHPHSPRFLRCGLRANQNQPGLPFLGNITLRWREEPEGKFHELKDKLLDFIAKQTELYTHAEAIGEI